MKRFFSFLILMIFCISLSGCEEISGVSTAESSQIPVDYPFEIDEVTFESAPQSIASLSPALTEIIYELGFGDKLTGRSSYCDYPPEVTSKTDIGSSANPDIASIIKLKPEVLVSQSPIANKDIVKITDAGIKVLILPSPTNYDQLKNNYVQLSMLFVGASKAKEKAEIVLTPLSDALQNIKKFETFAYIMTNDLAVATGDTLSGEILSYFGDNIAADYSNYSISAEELVAKQPSILFLASPLNIQNFSQQLAGLTAIQNSRIITIDNTSFERPTSRRLTELIMNIQTKIGSFTENATQSLPETTSGQ
ncbi:MAG TPA: helical backbone metal receptor [Oscillospiraceae bacterium]|mgnify:CR=1 FL=1|nr:helical backbone metal receptor [Oscillospiraceae bacterium]